MTDSVASHPRKTPPGSPPAFWLLGCGGTAKAGLETTDRLYRADRSPFFMRSTISDTDPLPTEAADSTLSLGVDVQQLNAVLADPQAFGPHQRTNGP